MIVIAALLLAWLTPLPEPLIAIFAFLAFIGWAARRDIWHFLSK
jgi:hypothetical protein